MLAPRPTHYPTFRNNSRVRLHRIKSTTPLLTDFRQRRNDVPTNDVPELRILPVQEPRVTADIHPQAMRDGFVVEVRQGLVDVVKPLDRARHAVVIRRRRCFQAEASLERRLVPDLEQEDAELEQRHLGLHALRRRPQAAECAPHKGAVEQDLGRGAGLDEEEDGVLGPGVVEPTCLEELQQAGGEADSEQHAELPGEWGTFGLEDLLEGDDVVGFFLELVSERAAV